MNTMVKSFSLISPISSLTEQEIQDTVQSSLAPIKNKLQRVLLIPPDYTRFHSNAGLIAEIIYQYLHPQSLVDVMPALGTHLPVSPTEWQSMFRSIPYDRMIEHKWRQDIVCVGEVPADYVSSVSEGLINTSIPVEVNRRLFDPSYDLIISIGQVVPHEVIGMSNYTKNILIGCGGPQTINASHMLGAVFGMERMMGQDHSPVRKVLDYASDHFLCKIPISYIFTVTNAQENKINTHGLFIGHERRAFEEAVALSQKKNITVLPTAPKKIVAYLDEKEFKSTWLGNKAVYRTRMAIADGGELIVLAPGVNKFGEDQSIDALIRKHGYKGYQHVLQALEYDKGLQNNLSAAAHLIHGSSEGRFSITYCTKHLSREEVEAVGYHYLPYDNASSLYSFEKPHEGWKTLSNGEEVYYIENPALGLWAEKGRLKTE